MTKGKAVKELENMRKFNYTLAPMEVFDMAIRALEQEPCEDAISRQAVLEFVKSIQKIKDDHNENGTPINYGTICDLVISGWHLMQLPSVTPISSVIDDIKADIRALPKTYPFVNHLDTYIKEDDVLEIIDKHISGK